MMRVWRLQALVFILILATACPVLAANGTLDNFWTANGTINATAVSTIKMIAACPVLLIFIIIHSDIHFSCV